MRDVLSWSFPIGQLFGITIRVHLTMPLFMIGMIARTATSKEQDVYAGSSLDVAMIMLLIFVSVLLHEFGHCFAARRMDGEADEVLLWPLGGLAFCRSLPHTPLPHFVTALGGPLVNLALCVLTGLILSLGSDQHYQPPFNPFWYPIRGDSQGGVKIPLWTGGSLLTQSMGAIFLARLFWVNWLQFLVNVVLIGIPFDGGRMLQAALWPRLGHYQSTKVAIYSGYAVLFLVVIFSIMFSEVQLVFLAIFIYVSCAQEMMTLESAHEDSLFGYDFSQGYTSLEKEEPVPPRKKQQNFLKRWLAQRAARKMQQEIEQREAEDRRMDELLDKIQKFGKDSLTDEEHRFLKRVADRYKNKP